MLPPVAEEPSERRRPSIADEFAMWDKGIEESRGEFVMWDKSIESRTDDDAKDYDPCYVIGVVPLAALVNIIRRCFFLMDSDVQFSQSLTVVLQTYLLHSGINAWKIFILSIILFVGFW